MNKWSGVIGFNIFDGNDEDEDGVYVPKIVEKKYRGDVLKNHRRLQSTDQKFDNIVISNRISILCKDSFLQSNINNMQYATFKGAKWKISDVEVDYPRVILTLGSYYNV